MPCAYPLDDFYARSGLALPEIESIPETQVPEPYHSLLVHERDMTSTLEQFHDDTIHIRALRSETRGDYYFREVVLLLNRDETPVEFGAIKINLLLFPGAARMLILGEREPLGHVLKEFALAYTSRPKAFLRLRSDDLINQALRLDAPRTLYGRRNNLLDSHQRPLAEVVEILPPTQ